MRFRDPLPVVLAVIVLAAACWSPGCSDDGGTAVVQPDLTPVEPPAPEPPPRPPKQPTIAKLTFKPGCGSGGVWISETDRDHLTCVNIHEGESKEIVLHRGGWWIVWASDDTCWHPADKVPPLTCWDLTLRVYFREGRTTEVFLTDGSCRL